MTHQHKWEHRDTEPAQKGADIWIHHAYCECGNGLHLVTRSSQPPDWDKYTEFDTQ